MSELDIIKVAHDIASRIPAMAQDCSLNNATVIERILRDANMPALLSPEEAARRYGRTLSTLMEWNL